MLDAVDEALADLDGNRADKLLDYAHHELRCTDAVVRPDEVGRMAMQEAVVHWYDQDPTEAVRWGWTVLDSVGAGASWPAVTPARLLAALAEEPLPELVGPEGKGLIPPKKGGYFRNGYLLIEPLAPMRVHGLVQAADKKGEVLETRWQDGGVFDEDWLGPVIQITPPAWFDPPPAPSRDAPVAAVGTDEVTLRWDVATTCPWQGDPRRIESSARVVRVKGNDFPVRTRDDQKAFLQTLRACGEFRAARRFRRWREARRKLALDAAKHKQAMERALRTPEPERRKRRAAQ